MEDTKVKHIRITEEDQAAIDLIKSNYGLISDSQVIRYVLRNFGVDKN